MHYISLQEWHRRQGSNLVPPDWQPPRRRFRLGAEDPDPGYTDWIQQVAGYLDGLHQETEKALKRIGHPVKLLDAVVSRAEEFWFQPDKLRRLVDARGQAADQLDGIVNILSTNLAISNEYLDAVLETAGRARSDAAKQALVQVLDITHADEAAL